MLVLLSRPEVRLQSRSRLGIPCRASWKPILLDTGHRYHEYHVTIHWKHESGWSVGIGWLISDRACTLLSASGSYNPPRTVSVFKHGAGCRSIFCNQNHTKINKYLIWIFRELVLLLNKLEKEELLIYYRL